MRPLPMSSGATRTARSCPWPQSRAQTRTNAAVAVAASTTSTTRASRSSAAAAAPLRASSSAAAAQSPSPSRFRGARRREYSIFRREAAASSSSGSDDGSNAKGIASGDGLNGGDETLQNAALLSQLLTALDAGGAPSVASLTRRGAPCEGARSLRFMQWLSDREDEAEEEASSGSVASSSSVCSSSPHSSSSCSPLSRLGEVLTVLREGLHADAFEELQEALSLAIAEAEEEGGEGAEGRMRLLLAEQRGLLLSPSSSRPAAGDGVEGSEEEEKGKEEDAVDALVAQRWRALAAARAGGSGSSSSSTSLAAAAALSLSLSPQGLAAAQRRALALSEGLKLQRARSAMELMGRVRTRRSGDGGEGEGEEAEAEEGNDDGAGTETGALPSLVPSSSSPPPYENLSPLPAEAAVAAALAGDPAPRILALLLEEPDPAARAALLPDAFDAGGSGGGAGAEAGRGGSGGGQGGESEGEAGDVDFVFTTPLKLVQAIDLELGRLERAAAGGESRGAANEERFAPPPLFLPGRGPAAAPAGGEDLVAVLEDLRQRAMEFV